MFTAKDAVLYANYGVCMVTDIRPESFGGNERLYYVLSPVYDANSTIYCPVDVPEGRLRPVMTAEEAESLLVDVKSLSEPWVENAQLRKENGRRILRGTDRREMIGLIKTLYTVRAEKQNSGKKMSVSDEELLREAERILHHELAYVLKIDPDEVVGYIAQRVEERA